MTKSEKLISAILTILVGVLFIAFKAGVVGWAMTVFGVVLIVGGVLNLVDHIVPPAVVKIVMGVVVIVFGWTLMSAVLYVFAAVLLIYGILQIYDLVVNKIKNVWGYLSPVFLVVIAVCLLFNQGGTINWVFVVSGIFLIIEGALLLVSAFDNRKGER